MTETELIEKAESIEEGLWLLITAYSLTEIGESEFNREIENAIDWEDFMHSAFTWKETQEGAKYWVEISETYKTEN